MDMTPVGVERHLQDLTGISGWRGVIESRNILRRTMDALSRRGGAAALSQLEARRFVRVVLRALEHWQDLVNQAADVARHSAAER